MRKGHIYKCVFPDGKIYVGQTRRDPIIRFKEHLDPKIGPKNPLFWEAYLKLGTPTLEIIETVERKYSDELGVALNQLETYYIQSLQTEAPNGYNIRPLGCIPVKEISILNDYYSTEINLFRDKVREHFAKLLEKKRTGQTLEEDDNQFLDKYLFGKENMYSDTFNKTYTDKKEQDFWEWHAIDYATFLVEEDSEAEERLLDYIREYREEIIQEYNDGKKILQIDDYGNIIAQFEDLYEITEKLKRPTENIRHALKGKQKKAFGYRWVYKKDFEDFKKKNPQEQLLFSLDF